VGINRCILLSRIDSLCLVVVALLGLWLSSAVVVRCKVTCTLVKRITQYVCWNLEFECCPAARDNMASL